MKQCSGKQRESSERREEKRRRLERFETLCTHYKRRAAQLS